MERLTLVPDSSGYSATPQAGYLRVALPGGPGRYRGDSLNMARMFNCTWTVDPEDYQYLSAFYRYFETTLESFLVSLAVDSAELEDYEAKIVPDSWSLGETKGYSFTVSCQIEATPVALPDAEFDAAIVKLRSEYSDIAELLSPLDKLVNYDFPEN